MKKSLIKDESAQVNVIIELGVVIFAAAIFYIAGGLIIDTYIIAVNDMGLIMSQYRLDTINMLRQGWKAFIILVGLVLMFFLIKTSASKEAEQVI